MHRARLAASDDVHGTALDLDRPGDRRRLARLPPLRDALWRRGAAAEEAIRHRLKAERIADIRPSAVTARVMLEARILESGLLEQQR
jgi:hypothetical protein